MTVLLLVVGCWVLVVGWLLVVVVVVVVGTSGRIASVLRKGLGHEFILNSAVGSRVHS
jgi:hypothetical protein